MSFEQNLIPIDEPLKDFKNYLRINDRCIFSARFGDGKSYFLSEFIKKNKSYLFIPIYPVNYQVAENKDIFEYIKRDVLIRLLSTEDIEIDNTSISNSLYLVRFLQNNGIASSLDLISLLPDINFNSSDISLSALATASKTLLKIKKKFSELKKRCRNETELAEDIIDSPTKQKGSIYEFDIVSQLICDLIDAYRKKHTRRKVVLLIEDLDRIDPEHIFRILNVFSAHFDRYNSSWSEVRAKGKRHINKFKFDKIVTVCHFENIKNIYHHRYGKETDFNGYICKFSPTNPYFYSLERYLKEYVKKLFPSELYKYSATCESLSAMIVNKYKETSIGIWGNIRQIVHNLKQPQNINLSYIAITENLKICSINDLTRLLNILHHFNLKWDNLSAYYNNHASHELNDLIGECWLYSKYGDTSIIIKDIRTNSISLGYKNQATSIIIDSISVSHGVIKDFPMNEIVKRKSHIKETLNVMYQLKEFIINHFCTYLSNPPKNIIS